MDVKDFKKEHLKLIGILKEASKSLKKLEKEAKDQSKEMKASLKKAKK